MCPADFVYDDYDDGSICEVDYIPVFDPDQEPFDYSNLTFAPYNPLGVRRFVTMVVVYPPGYMEAVEFMEKVQYLAFQFTPLQIRLWFGMRVLKKIARDTYLALHSIRFQLEDIFCRIPTPNPKKVLQCSTLSEARIDILTLRKQKAFYLEIKIEDNLPPHQFQLPLPRAKIKDQLIPDQIQCQRSQQCRSLLSQSPQNGLKYQKFPEYSINNLINKVYQRNIQSLILRMYYNNNRSMTTIDLLSQSIGPDSFKLSSSFASLINGTSSISKQIFEVLREVNPTSTKTDANKKQVQQILQTISQRAREVDASPVYDELKNTYHQIFDESTQEFFSNAYMLTSQLSATNIGYKNVMDQKDTQAMYETILSQHYEISRELVTQDQVENSLKDIEEVRLQAVMGYVYAIGARRKDLEQSIKEKAQPQQILGTPYSLAEVFDIVELLLNPEVNPLLTTYQEADSYRDLIDQITTWISLIIKNSLYVNWEMINKLCQDVRQSSQGLRLTPQLIKSLVIKRLKSQDSSTEQLYQGTAKVTLGKVQLEKHQQELFSLLTSKSESQRAAIDSLTNTTIPDLLQRFQERQVNVITALLYYWSLNDILVFRAARVQTTELNILVKSLCSITEGWITSINSAISSTIKMYKGYTKTPITYIDDQYLSEETKKKSLNHLAASTLADILELQNSRQEETQLNSANSGGIKNTNVDYRMNQLPLIWESTFPTKYNSSNKKKEYLDIKQEFKTLLTNQFEKTRQSKESQPTIQEFFMENSVIIQRLKDIIESKMNRLEWGQLKDLPMAASTEDLKTFNNALIDIIGMSQIKMKSSTKEEQKIEQLTLGQQLYDRISHVQFNQVGQLIDKNPEHRIRSYQTLILMTIQIFALQSASLRLKTKVEFTQIGVIDSQQTFSQEHRNLQEALDKLDSNVMRPAILTLQEFYRSSGKNVSITDDLQDFINRLTLNLPSYTSTISLLISKMMGDCELKHLSQQTLSTRMYAEQQTPFIADFDLGETLKLSQLWDPITKKKYQQSALRKVIEILIPLTEVLLKEESTESQKKIIKRGYHHVELWNTYQNNKQHLLNLRCQQSMVENIDEIPKNAGGAFWGSLFNGIKAFTSIPQVQSILSTAATTGYQKLNAFINGSS